jgi:hypothetical protein
MISRVIVRDSVLLLIPAVCLGFGLGGVEWGLPILAAGGVAIANLLILIALVHRIFRPGGHWSALAGMALMAKMGVAGAALFLLLQAFPPAPTLIGFGIGIAAITLRGLAGFEALTGAEA